MAETSIPFTIAKNLPVYTGAVEGDIDFIAVVGNNRTVRVPASSVADGFVVWKEPYEVSAGSDTGHAHCVSADTTGFYSFADGRWAKSPTYRSNWDDLTETTRFLKVDAGMDLTKAERDNVYASIKLGTATKTTAGLVKAQSGTWVAQAVMDDDAFLGIKEASKDEYGAVRVDNEEDETSVVSMGYLEGRLASRDRDVYKIATHESPGVILADNPEPDEAGYKGPFQVDEYGNVTIPTAIPGDNVNPGLVRLSRASLNDDEGSEVTEDAIRTAASIQRVGLMITDAINTQAGKSATEVSLGSVMVPGDGALRIIMPSTPEDQRPAGWADGSIDVNPGDSIRHGAVLVRNTLAGVVKEQAEINGLYYYYVPTAAAVRREFDDIKANILTLDGGKIDSDKLPIATNMYPGAVKIGTGIALASDGTISQRMAVPTTFETYVQGSSQVFGAVYVCRDSYEGTTGTSLPVVPTVAKVKSMLAGQAAQQVSAEMSHSYVRSSVSEDVETGQATIVFTAGSFFEIDPSVDSVKLVLGDVSDMLREAYIIWAPSEAIHDFRDEGVLEGVTWDANSDTVVDDTKRYLIRLTSLPGQRMVLAAVAAAY